MATFFKKYSRIIVNLFVNQLGMTVFGFIVSTFALTYSQKNAAEGDNLFLLVASIFSIVFYMFLVLVATNEEGVRDKIRIDAGRIKKEPSLGFFWGLCAALPNYLLAIIAVPTYFIYMSNTSLTALGRVSAITEALARILEAPYSGLVSVIFSDTSDATAMALKMFTLFFLPLPAILFSWFGYLLGINGKMLLPEKKKKK